MMIFMILAPYGAFAGLMLVSSTTISLFAAAALCLVVIASDAVRGRSIKVLGAGSAILFAALGSYLAMTETVWSSSAVKLTVDTGVLAITLASLAIGKPFTLQYAREQVAPELWDNPKFIRTNYVITGVWALAFAVMVVAELALLYVPGLPRRAGVIAIVVALIGAVKFTGWYPERGDQSPG